MKFRLNEPTERKTFLTVSLSFFGANLMMEQLNPKKVKSHSNGNYISLKNQSFSIPEINISNIKFWW